MANKKHPHRDVFCFLSGRPDSNWRPSPWQGDVLPTELLPHALSCGTRTRTGNLRVMSPTSCQLLHPACILYSLQYNRKPKKMQVRRRFRRSIYRHGASDRNRTGVIGLENRDNNHYTTLAFGLYLIAIIFDCQPCTVLVRGYL